MKKIVTIFGLISGAISAGMILATVPFVDRLGFDKSEVIGYTTIVLSALLVFFGVRAYRENSGGRLTFSRGFVVGILITLVSSLCYVLTWEVVYYTWMPDFADKYAAQMVERAKSSGANPENIEKATREARQFKEMYKNPVVNVALTFAEVFPIGLGVTLLSAAILRRKSRTTAQQGAAATRS